MAAEHWFRWHHGTVTDPKWRVIASRCVTCVTPVTVCHVVAVWAAMVENASQATPRGQLSGWDDEDIAVCLGIEIEQVFCIREAMQGKVLNGECLSAWGKRQPNREDKSTERTREWRERQRAERDASKRAVTQCDASKRAVTLETETETETEKKEQKKKPLDHRADDRARIKSDFDTKFWAAYPRKVGKANAWRAFSKIAPSPELLAVMLAALDREKLGNEQWRRDDGQFIPHPATWLNGRRWEDETPSVGVLADTRIAL